MSLKLIERGRDKIELLTIHPFAQKLYKRINVNKVHDSEQKKSK